MLDVVRPVEVVGVVFVDAFASLRKEVGDDNDLGNFVDGELDDSVVDVHTCPHSLPVWTPGSAEYVSVVPSSKKHTYAQFCNVDAARRRLLSAFCWRSGLESPFCTPAVGPTGPGCSPKSVPSTLLSGGIADTARTRATSQRA